MTWKDKALLVLVPLVLVLFGVALFLGYQRMQSLDARNRATEQRIDDWAKIISTLTTEQQKLLREVGVKNVQQYDIRMDVGKEIKEFNKTVKELQQIEDPYESIKALDRAWSGG